MKTAPLEGAAIRVRGLVQGVGFRPAVWRLARDCGMVGEVWNDPQGVMIRAWGDQDSLERFIRLLRDEAPPLARVDAIEAMALHGAPDELSFRIVPSHGGRVRTGIVPDAAACRACRDETFDRAGRRHRYPFTNCTHCGPRLSIVRAIPYDRANTSMAAFLMCRDCEAEYENPDDRRFHAQPLACPDCGPRVWLEPMGDAGPSAVVGDAIEEAAGRLLAGDIIAIKGIGGFHLACDAGNAEAVARLRARKHRYRKPFALMARDIVMVRGYCAVGPEAEALLRSAAAPIVILDATGPLRVAEAVVPGQRTLGFMLPYTPLHHLLLERIERPIVLTSGNRAEEPQCTGNHQARHSLSSIADCGLFHDRDIVNRSDDSVSRFMAGEARMLRRARGYAPAPIGLPEGFADAPPILALGGELKNAFCLVQKGQAILSQHIGDLADAATFADYRHSLALYGKLFGHEPRALAIDCHPEYLASKLGREWAAEQAVGLQEVQHHHAHIAACMAENGVPLGAAPVLGIALDGLGYGGDGGFWGGEFLLADYRAFVRLGCFQPVAMPGGAQAVHEPWRSTFAHLDAAIGWEACVRERPNLEIIRFLEARPLATLRAMIAAGINSPWASSCGRLFDAVAAALGICRHRASYEGEAAILLEAIADADVLDAEEGYPFAIDAATAPNSGSGNAPATLDSAPMWRALLADLVRGTPASVVAARFHAGLARAVVAMALLIAERDGRRLTGTVALSGGSFQNRVLLERIMDGLRAHGLEILAHRQVPPNDGGLALGQAAVAAARLLERQECAAERGASCA